MGAVVVSVGAGGKVACAGPTGVADDLGAAADSGVAVRINAAVGIAARAVAMRDSSASGPGVVVASLVQATSVAAHSAPIVLTKWIRRTGAVFISVEILEALNESAGIEI